MARFRKIRSNRGLPSGIRGLPTQLVQRGNGGFFTSPDEPASPYDCARWPNSPFCGGNPFRLHPVGFETEIIIDECNVGISIVPIVGFIAAPNVDLVYRKKSCRDKKPEPPPTNKFPPTALPNLPLDFEGFFLLKAELLERYNYNFPDWHRCRRQYVLASNKRYGNVTSYSYKYDPAGEDNDRNRPLLTLTATYDQHIFINEGEKCLYPTSYDDRYHYDLSLTNTDIAIREEYTYPSSVFRWIFGVPGGIRQRNGPHSTGLLALYGKFSDVIAVYGETYYYNSKNEANVAKEYDIETIVKYTILNYKPAPKAPPPPKKPRPPKRMNCCPQLNAKLDKILRLIGQPTSAKIYEQNLSPGSARETTVPLRSLFEAHKAEITEAGKLAKMVGVNSFPLQLPDSLVEKKGKGKIADLLGFILPDKQRTIRDIPELIDWLGDQFDTVMGDWEQVIEVEDTDPEKSGNQSETISLPNVSLTLRELFMMQATQAKVTGMILDVTLKALTEMANTKVMVAKVSANLNELINYLDYPTRDQKGSVDTQITIPKSDEPDEIKEDLSRYLEASKQSFTYEDWTGSKSLQEQLNDLLYAATILKATFTKSEL